MEGHLRYRELGPPNSSGFQGMGMEAPQAWSQSLEQLSSLPPPPRSSSAMSH